ncbi:MAG TPA: histidinol dehydrogenase [Savagea sp.]
MKIVTAEAFFQSNRSGISQLNTKVDDLVLSIIQEVQKRGDQALLEYTEQFDGAKLEQLYVQEEEFESALAEIPNELKQALMQAKQQIEMFHEKQKEASWYDNFRPGVTLGQKITPIERVGIYVPGGKAVYPSTVLMNVIPAQIAGVKELIIATPPRADGTIDPVILAAAQIAGVKKIIKVGGAQAIAALAYGTASIPKVDKITGPGNQFVARAKKWVFGDVAIDMIAGPSEICIYADESTNPSFAAADLLSQAEHDERAQAICVTVSQQVALTIQAEVKQQLSRLKRKKIAEESILNEGAIILVRDEKEAIAVMNRIAPEHLQLMNINAVETVDAIQHAGAIFIGQFSAEVVGDYLAGPNHTLPTSGTARFSSPLGVYDFMKRSSVIHYSEAALLREADAILTIAEQEQLEGHAQAIRIRKGAFK